MRNEPLKPEFALMKELEVHILQKASPGDIVLIGMRHSCRFGPDWVDERCHNKQFLYETSPDKFTPTKDKSYFFDQWERNFRKFATKAESKEISIILSTPTPEFPEISQQNCKGINPQWFNYLSTSDCATISSSFFVGKAGIYSKIIKSLREITDRHPNVFLNDAYSSICIENECSLIYAGKSMYRDDDHLSNYGALTKVLPSLKNLANKHDL